MFTGALFDDFKSYDFSSFSQSTIRQTIYYVKGTECSSLSHEL